MEFTAYDTALRTEIQRLQQETKVHKKQYWVRVAESGTVPDDNEDMNFESDEEYLPGHRTNMDVTSRLQKQYRRVVREHSCWVRKLALALQ